MSALFDGELEEQADKDAERARELVADALNKNTVMYRTFGADRILAAAQVYATLATRA